MNQSYLSHVTQGKHGKWIATIPVKDIFTKEILRQCNRVLLKMQKMFEYQEFP